MRMVHGGSGWWRLAGFIFVTNCLMDEWRLWPMLLPLGCSRLYSKLSHDPWTTCKMAQTCDRTHISTSADPETIILLFTVHGSLPRSDTVIGCPAIIHEDNSHQPRHSVYWLPACLSPDNYYYTLCKTSLRTDQINGPRRRELYVLGQTMLNRA